MSPDPGGVFDSLHWLVQRGPGGRVGDGRQFVSCVHYEDFVAAIRSLIDRADTSGVVSIAAPNPVPNSEFIPCWAEAARDLCTGSAVAARCEAG